MKALQYKIRSHYSHYPALPHNIEAFCAVDSNMYNCQDWPDWMHEAYDKDLDDGGAICQHKGIFYLRNSGIPGDVVRITEDDYIVRCESGSLSLCNGKSLAETYKVVEK